MVEHAVTWWILFHVLFYFLQFIIRQHPRSWISPNVDYPVTIDTLNRAYLGLGFSCNEAADRDRAINSADADGIQLANSAVFQGITNSDIHFFLAIVRSVIPHEDSVSNQLDGSPYFSHVGSQHGCLGTIDVDLPFDSGNRPGIIDVDETGHIGFHEITYALCFTEQRAQFLSGQFHLNFLAHGGTLLYHRNFGPYTGNF